VSLPPNAACAEPASGRVLQSPWRHFVGVDWGGYGAGHQDGDLFVIDKAETFQRSAAHDARDRPEGRHADLLRGR